MTSFFQWYVSHFLFFKNSYLKNVPKQRTPVISGLLSHWLKYPGGISFSSKSHSGSLQDSPRRNFLWNHFWCCVGIATCTREMRSTCCYGYFVTGACKGGWGGGCGIGSSLAWGLGNLGFSLGLAII